MSDYLLLAGVALCVISVIAAILQVLQTQPPRGAVITLIIGIVLIFAGAYTSPKPFAVSDICSAWGRVTGTAPAESPAEPADTGTGGTGTGAGDTGAGTGAETGNTEAPATN